MPASHTYELGLQWTGNTGTGTTSYRSYERTHELRAPGKPVLVGSADVAFRGDADRWNPEELLVASLSGCHLLSYLHQAAVAGVVVIDYTDEPRGEMVTGTEADGPGGGHFVEVLLRPTVVVAEPGMIEVAEGLHEPAHQKCFIANSVNFPVRHAATVIAAGSSGTPTEA
jgi:organic hydroperoxide reductase OsmC/OhrA